MANFDALFAGCESFMEGDVEINNDVTVPGSEGEALEAESVAEDVGTEGGEIAGEAETEDTKAEAANMVFDQLLNMYQHVRRYGVDRTFLSLYNGNGQLNRMVGYRFPSCESIDSVGSPRSQASRAFIIAMEEDGIFKRIWTWIKETAVKVYNFFIKVMDWFREACGNLDLRVGRLWKYFNEAGAKKWEDIKDKNVKYIEKSAVDNFTTKGEKLNNEVMQIAHRGGVSGISVGSNTGLIGTVASASASLATQMKNLSAGFKKRSLDNSGADNYHEKTKFKDLDKNDDESDDAYNTRNSEAKKNFKSEDKYTYGQDYYGRTKDKDDKDGVNALKEYIDRINKDIVDPLADAVSDMSLESDDLEAVNKADRFFALVLHVNTMGIVSIDRNATNGENTNLAQAGENPGIHGKEGIACKMLASCKDVLKDLLQQKHAMDMMNLANKQARQLAEQEVRQSGTGSHDYEYVKDQKLSMMGIVKGNSVIARITTLNEKIVAKCCSLAASLQSCVKANGDQTK